MLGDQPSTNKPLLPGLIGFGQWCFWPLCRCDPNRNTDALGDGWGYYFMKPSLEIESILNMAKEAHLCGTPLVKRLAMA